MSHFSVMVVSDSKPSEQDLEQIMQPWHEFECTGTDDQYVVDLDETDELRKQYQESTEKRLRDKDGNLHYPYDDAFYRDPLPTESVGYGSGVGNGISWQSKDWGDGQGYRPKVRFVPDGFDEVELPTPELESFRDWVAGYCGREPVVQGTPIDLSEKHKYGYALIDSNGEVIKVINRTNPNSRWDYWRIGGRYRSKLQIKAGVTTAVSSEPSWEWQRDADPIPEGFDQARVGDIDREAMKQAAVESRRNWISEDCEKCELSFEDFEKGLVQYHEYHQQWMQLDHPRPRGGEFYQAMEDAGYYLGAIVARKTWEKPELGELSLEEWILAAPSLSAFAVVMDGQWYANGEMGWWGAVHDENDDWGAEFAKMFAGLHDDQWITFLDCHT